MEMNTICFHLVLCWFLFADTQLQKIKGVLPSASLDSAFAYNVIIQTDFQVFFSFLKQVFFLSFFLFIFPKTKYQVLHTHKAFRSSQTVQPKIQNTKIQIESAFRDVKIQKHFQTDYRKFSKFKRK